MKPFPLVLTAAALLAPLVALNAAELRLPAVFGDHMVFQRDKPARVWGWADKGDTVTVEFAGQKKSAKVVEDGTWLVTLDPMPVNATGRALTVKSENPQSAIRNLQFSDVLVGDVWLGSGQSNMELELGGMERGDIAAFQADYPLIRLMAVPGETSDKPQDDIPGVAWKICTPATAAGFSAVAYYFARDVHEALKVPIGMMVSARGGTYPESWQTRQSLESLNSPFVTNLLAQSEKRVADWIANPKGQDPRHGEPGLGLPAGCYNHMIHPIEKFAIKGALFYQGENSAVNHSMTRGYPQTYPAVIRNWRQLFSDPNLPFCIIEMAPWGGRGPLLSYIDSTSPFVRDVHFRTHVNWPHTGLVVTMDCGKLDDMHPTRKEPVGRRAALWALSQVYHVGNRIWIGPLYRSMDIKGNKAVIHFHSDGLSLPLSLQNPTGRVDGFVIAGTNYLWREAQAAIMGDTVEVWSDSVTNPAAVRYAWEDALGLVNLIVNADGLPASPFRTDRWVPPTRTGALLDQPLLLPAEGARPWADPGSDVLALASRKNITLDGSGSYSPVGTIVKYAWAQVSGPDVKMSGAVAPTLSITSLAEGTYAFRLAVTDNHGNTDSRDVAVRLVARSQPVAVAGKKQTVPFPHTSAVLDGSGSDDKLASIASFAWQRVSGPGDVSLADAAAAKTTVTGLKVGTHVFRLTITDSLGEKASDDVTLAVMPPAAPVIYEPFACPARAELDGQGGVGDIGFSAAWRADKGCTMTSGGLTYSNLAVAGNAVSLRTVGTNGTARTIDASALASRSLLADGAELWFSFLVRDSTREGCFNGLMLGDSRTESGNGVGVWFDEVVIPKAVIKVAGVKHFSPGHGPYAIWEKRVGLVVGLIKWGVSSADPDSVQLYLPSHDLKQPLANPVLVVSGKVDQSKFNLITVGPGPRSERDVRIDEIRFGKSYYDVVPTKESAEPDVTPPHPSPMLWATMNPSLSDSIITLSAATATDLHDVEYYFANTAVTDGSHDSGWIASPIWTDQKLNASTAYSYRVKVRDLSANHNEAGWSPVLAATTTPPDTIPPTPNPMTWAVPPVATAPSVIRMTAATAADPSWVEYYFANITVTNHSHDSGWVTNTTYVDTGLEPNTEYAYTVKTRDLSPKQNVADVAPTASARTKPAGLAIYEPFDYPADSDLAGKGGTTDIGFTGRWMGEKKCGLIMTNLLSYGNHPSKGKTLKWASPGINGTAAVRAIDVAALAQRGLLADGGELWFSMLVMGRECVNLPSGSLVLDDSRKNSSTRIGMHFWRYSAIMAHMVSGGIVSNSQSRAEASPAPVLVVGRITWAVDPNAADTLQIYLPGKDLVLPPANPAQATSAIMDQSKLDSLRIESGGWGSSFMVGEIRFGATYRDVMPGAPPSTPARTPLQTNK